MNYAVRIAGIIIIFCFLSLGSAWGDNDEGSIKIKSPGGSIVIGFTKGNGDVSTKADHEIVATLPSNPTTGYHWQLMKPLAVDTVKLVGHAYTAPQTRLVGAGGTETWIFRTVGRGETEISLGYVRPWEKDVPPAGIRTIRLKVSP